MNMMKRIGTLLLLGCMLMSAAGCGAVIAGGAAAGGTYVYLDGQAKADYRASLRHTYDAALAGCKEIGMTVTSQSLDGSSASIKGRYHDEDIFISLSLEGDNFTKVTVRVGILGNETESRRIHDAIKRNL